MPCRAVLFTLVCLAGCATLPSSAQTPPSPDAVVRLASRGDTAALVAALDAGADPDAFGVNEMNDPQTPLMAAAEADRPDAVRLLLARGASPTLADAEGNTPIRSSADGRSAVIARLLIEAGADVEARTTEGASPLAWAAFLGADEVAATLLDAGADIEGRSAGGSTPLGSAIRTFGDTYGNASTVALLLARGADPNRANDRGVRPLHKAVSETPGGLLVTALLLDGGADAGERNGDGQTPGGLARQRAAARILAFYLGDPETLAEADLLLGILHDDAEAVRAALAAGADPDAGVKDNDFYANDFLDDGGPLHLAARVGAGAGVVQALADGGATLDAVSSSGHPAVKVAAERGNVATLRAMLAAGAAPESTTERPFLGMEPIHWAASAGEAEAVQVLLDAGAVPDYSTNASMGYGYNALGFAVHHGHLETARVLLDAGMETDQVGETPYTALDVAVERGWPEIEALLRDRDAQTTAEMAQAEAAALLDASGPEAAWASVANGQNRALMRALLALDQSPPPDVLVGTWFALQFDPGLVPLLVAAGADVNAAASDGMTALHSAAADGRGPLVAALLDAGADATLADATGKTPLDWALEYDDPETVALLSADTP